MKFQPTAHMGGENLLQPCCELNQSGSTQIYQNINGVEWQINLYTSSIQLGGATGSAETFDVAVTGSTKHAIVACVGGGGSAYSRQASAGFGYGGGGGGVFLTSSLELKAGSTYTATIGNGGDGFTCGLGAPPCDPNGADGQPSSFVGGGHNIVGGGGEGSTISGGSGGSSGIPNAQSGSATGGSGAALIATGSTGAFGLSVFVGNAAPIFRAGGGGVGDAPVPTPGVGNTSSEFGGNSTVLTREEGASNWTFGGGSAGHLQFDSPSSTYFSTPAGSGCVMVAVPMNLCSSSLYQKTDYVKGDLVNYWDFSNPKTFGKTPYNSKLTDIRNTSNSLFAQGTGSVVTLPSSSVTLQTQNYLGDVPILYDDTSSDTYPTSRLVTYDAQKVSGSLDTTAAAFSYEWYGVPTGNPETLFSINQLSKNDELSNPKIILTQTGGGRLDYIAPGGAETQLSGTITTSANNHVVLTYNGSVLKLYVNAVEEDTATVSVTSDLDNPMIFLGDAAINGDSNSHHLFRAYNDELTSDEVMQNYSASAAL